MPPSYAPCEPEIASMRLKPLGGAQIETLPRTHRHSVTAVLLRLCAAAGPALAAERFPEVDGVVGGDLRIVAGARNRPVLAHSVSVEVCQEF